MDLRPLARPFLSCFIQSGETALFWHDNWTGLGPLIEITGANGPQVSGIALSSVVSQAIFEGEWTVTRGRHRVIQLLRACLPAQPPTLIHGSDDYFLWRTSADTVPSQFSASRTWKALHPTPATVPWYSSIWFKSGIPKHAFHAWVSVRECREHQEDQFSSTKPRGQISSLMVPELSIMTCFSLQLLAPWPPSVDLSPF
ncbi:PREDICTED: uncharacterized protein LOC106339228 [Brassica oleracea var. oleracea]|uniref:uncharacterized protein LOC106339228 n=1 Tax=Brassica oleracea var. oleracea TaxID=109376 RepID=UPI0006A701F0|nr:PREDICTED: uncharacterized protein LOC106339228 [Brassica oleracea var. oleracea]